MAVYQITNKFLLDNFAIVTTLLDADLTVGGSIVVAGVDSTFNGTYSIYALPEYEFIGVNNQGELLFNGSNPMSNQIMYAKTAANVQMVAATGTLTYTPVCTWVTGTDIADWLGITYASDSTFLDLCAAATNQFCWRRRQESNYVGDSLSIVPSQDVKMGTIMMGGAIYRQRGSIDSFASFSEMGTAPVVGLSPIIKQMLGLGAHAVA
jgi:hypothetical protein